MTAPARSRPDLRLVPAFGASWLAAWLVLGVAGLPAPVGARFAAGLAAAAAGTLVVLSAAAVAAARRRRAAAVSVGSRPPGRGPGQRSGPLLLAAAVVACVAGTTGSAALRVVAVRSGPVADLAGDQARVDAELSISADPRSVVVRRPGRPDRRIWLVEARLLAARAGRVQVRSRAAVLVIAADPAWAGLLPGQPVSIRGARLDRPRPGDRFAAVVLVRGPPGLTGRPGAVQRAAGHVRAGLRQAVAGLPPDPRGLVPGLVVGDVSALPEDLEAAFRTAGLTHLVAVSGANCAIVLGAVLLAGRWVGLRGRWLPAAGALALLGFLVLARPQPSVLRATAMGLVTVAAVATGRRRQGLATLAAAGIALLLADPWLARSYGFALSVLATGGLLVLARPWADVLATRLPRPLAHAVAVPAAAQAVCAPVVVLLSAQLSLVAVPANLLVAPAVPPATVLGVLAAAVAPVSPPLATGLGTLAGLPAGWIALVARGGAAVPAAAVPWPGGVGGAVLLAALTAAALLSAAWWRRADRPARPLCRPSRSVPRSRPRRRAVLVLVALAAGGLLGSAAAGPRGGPIGFPDWLTGAAWPPPGWVLVACDVGQGDALLLRAGGADATAVVVDAGPDPAAVDRCLRDAGIRRVALLVLSHLHADHIGGLPGVLAGRRVDAVLIGPLDEPVQQATWVAATLRRAGVPVHRGMAGQAYRVGSLDLQVLGPRPDGAEAGSPNDASLVLLARRDDVRVLLTGDVEDLGQAALGRVLDRDGDGAADNRIDVLKVPHHGSPVQSPALVHLVGARLAVVSVGAGNDYGHPAPRTLRMLREAGAVVARTDEDGDVAVVGAAERLGLVRRGR